MEGGVSPDLLPEDGRIAAVGPEPYPARTTVGTAFPVPGMLVEIDCVALLPAELPGGGSIRPMG